MIDKDYVIAKLQNTILNISPIKGYKFIPLSVVTHIDLKGTPCFVLPFYLKKSFKSEPEELLYDLAGIGFGEKEPYFLVVTYTDSYRNNNILASVSLKKSLLLQTEISDCIPELKNDTVISHSYIVDFDSDKILNFVSFEITRIASSGSEKPTYTRVRVK